MLKETMRRKTISCNKGIMANYNKGITLKSNKGITLIALVITIIVLLILAGVVIATLTGENGLLNRASGAKEAQEKAEVIEKARIDIIDQYAENEGKEVTQTQIEGICKKYDKDGEIKTDGEGKQYIETEHGYKVLIEEITKGLNVSGGSGTGNKVNVGEESKEQGTINGEEGTYQNPTVPQGYVPINTDTAKWDDANGPQYNNGLVISDAASNGNEWVWVPVPDATVMYETSDTAIALSGSTGVTTNKYSKSGIISGQTRGLPGSTSYREPDIIVGNGTEYDAANYSAAGFSSLGNMAETMVAEYKDMIESISKYGGFYIGRYELTADGERPGATLVNKNWYDLYAKCKTLSKENSNTTTRMIWGCQWDVTCNWLADNGYNITDSSSWGNYRDSTGNAAVSGYSSKQNTGYSEYWKANNIYDLAGNCWEWTQEVYSSDNRADRGGYYNEDGSHGPATAHYYSVPTISTNNNLRYTCHFNIEPLIGEWLL